MTGINLLNLLCDQRMANSKKFKSMLRAFHLKYVHKDSPNKSLNP